MMAVGICGVALFNAPIWLSPGTPFALPVMLIGLIGSLVAIHVLWGLRNKAILEEDAAYRKSLEPKKPWE